MKSVVSVHQPSITEWFAAIGERREAAAFREEDNRKANRLEVLYQTTGLPYERPEPFSARDLTDRRPRFAKLLAERGRELCAIRLVPNRAGLPKLRNRGLSIRRCYETWYRKLDIDPDAYTAYVCPHSDRLKWSSIFIVGTSTVFGEIVRGRHSQLTQGETSVRPVQFRYDFKRWQWSRSDRAARQPVRRMVAKLLVGDLRRRASLRRTLGARFSHRYLAGYFETTVWPDGALYFIDYNRLLPRYVVEPTSLALGSATPALLRGATGSPGRGRGSVVVVSERNVKWAAFPRGAVLVCDNTDVRYLPYMRRAAAIVTDRGGVLSHAAIVSRELKKPCVIGTGAATRVLRRGDRVEVDATNGLVRKLAR